MPSSESRAEVMKPLLINAGIPAALSVAAYIFARIVSKRSNLSNIDSSSLQTEDQNYCHEESESFHTAPDPEPDHEECDSITHLQIWNNNEGNTNNNNNLEHKLVDLESQLEDLQKRENDAESRYLSFRAKKDREFLLTEIRNKMILEKTRAEFLLKEISLAEEENKRIGGLVIECIKLVSHLQGFRAENRLLQRKARKVCRKAAGRLSILRQQKLSIEAKDEMLVRNRTEIEAKDCVIQEFEDEVKLLKEAVDHLQREKIELINKVDVQTSGASDIQVESTESVTKEEYESVLKELEQVQKERESEANELTYLKWSNTCLRHELVRYHEQQEHSKEDNHHHHQLAEFLLDEHAHENEDCKIMMNNNSNVVTSKRRRFMQKLKKWVDVGGHNVDEKDNEKDDQVVCFGKHSVSEETEDNLFVHARKSCSSV